jgi:hypothetical protein
LIHYSILAKIGKRKDTNDLMLHKVSGVTLCNQWPAWCFARFGAKENDLLIFRITFATLVYTLILGSK